MSRKRFGRQGPKFLLLGLAFAGLGLALFCFDGASAQARAHQSALAIALSPHLLEGPARTRALDEAGAILPTALSTPLNWRADAAETQSWIAALQAQGSTDFEQSRILAERAARLSPANAVAYQRLAAFSLRGAPNGLCAPRACLERAFAAAPMIDETIACDRLRLAHLAGLRFSADDARLLNYLALRPSPQRLRQCLDFVEPDTLYIVLLRARARGLL